MSDIILAVILALFSGIAATVLFEHIREAVNPHLSSEKKQMHWRVAWRSIMRDFKHAWLIYVAVIVVLGLSIWQITGAVKNDNQNTRDISDTLKRIEQKTDNLTNTINDLIKELRESK